MGQSGQRLLHLRLVKSCKIWQQATQQVVHRPHVGPILRYLGDNPLVAMAHSFHL